MNPIRRLFEYIAYQRGYQQGVKDTFTKNVQTLFGYMPDEILQFIYNQEVRDSKLKEDVK